MGQKKCDRSTQWKLDRANAKLNETTRELMRRVHENKEAINEAEAEKPVEEPTL